MKKALLHKKLKKRIDRLVCLPFTVKASSSKSEG